MSSEEDDVHKLTSAVLACLSTYVSYDEKSDKKLLIFSPNKNCMDTRALKRKERVKGVAEVMQVTDGHHVKSSQGEPRFLGQLT